MSDKISRLAEKYPVEYRVEIEEILKLRQDTNNALAEQGKKVRVTVDECNAQMSHYLTLPNSMMMKARTNSVQSDLETARRINKRRRGK